MLEQRGVRAFVICSLPFERLGRTQANTFGVPDLPLILITHPLGGIGQAQVQERVDQALPPIRALVRKHFQ